LQATFQSASFVTLTPLPTGNSRQSRPSKQQRLRAELISAGLALFRRKGFEGTTVTEIAEAAGTSRRTFFRYFESKDDVVFDWLDEQGALVGARLATQPAGITPMVAMHDALLSLARFLDADRERATLLTRIVFDTPALSRRYQAENSRWEAEVTEYLLRGRDAADFFTLRVQVSAATAALVVAMRAWAEDDHGKPLAHWVAAAFAALTAGQAELSA